MPLNPNILLGLQPADTSAGVQSFQNSLLNMQRAREISADRKLKNEQAEQQALASGLQLESLEQSVGQGRRQITAQDGFQVHSAAKSLREISDPEQRAAVMGLMAPELINRFGFTEQDLADGLDDNELDAVMSSTQQYSTLGKGKGQKGESIFFERDGKQFRSTSVFNPGTGQIEEVVTEIGQSADITSKRGETVEEQTERKIKEAGGVKKTQLEQELKLKPDIAAAEVTGKGTAGRQQVAIDQGLDAADGYANLIRAKDLLSTVETGGINAASLRAKQIFGVEGADEAELSNRMGKAVLSQLRTTFGAAFTAKEGESLQRIEANYGKSTEGNRRLLDETIKLVDRAAQRGIRAAESAGDTEAAQNIRDALNFRLGDAQPTDISNKSDEDLLSF